MKNITRKILQKIGLHWLAGNLGVFRESKLAHQYCLGKGIEIGGSAHNPFALDTLNIDYSDSMGTSFKKNEKHLCGTALPVDIVAAGDYLPLADESQDFVVSSHVLEHFANPIKTLLEWDRVIRPMGIIFMIVPHKERTFDKKRERTPLVHLIDDFHSNSSGPTDDEHGHHHVWITEDIVELIHHMMSAYQVAWDLLRVEDRDDKVGNGFTVIIRKLKSRAGTVIASDHRKSCH